MTKKHFQMVADVIKGYPDHSPSLRTAKVSFANSFADKFLEVNPRFKIDVFAKACGLETLNGAIVFSRADYNAE